METQALSRISVCVLHRIDAQWIYSSKSDVFKEDYAGGDAQVG